MISGAGVGERMKKMKKDVRIIRVEELVDLFEGRLFEEEGIGWWISLDDYRVTFNGTPEEEEELLTFFQRLLNTMEGCSSNMLSYSDLGGILFMVDMMEQNDIIINMEDKEYWKFIIEEYLDDVGRYIDDELLFTCDGRVWERKENGYKLVGMRILDEEIGFKEEERTTLYYGLVEYQESLQESIREHFENAGKPGYGDSNLEFLATSLGTVLKTKERLEQIWNLPSILV